MLSDHLPKIIHKTARVSVVKGTVLTWKTRKQHTLSSQINWKCTLYKTRDYGSIWVGLQIPSEQGLSREGVLRHLVMQSLIKLGLVNILSIESHPIEDVNSP